MEKTRDRQTEYLFQLANGQLIYVSRKDFQDSDYEDPDFDLYATFKVFMGNGEVMREIAITDGIRRYRDGGTTYIPTAEGMLYSPSAFNEKVWPSFNDVPMMRLDHSLFTIEETAQGVTVRGVA